MRFWTAVKIILFVASLWAAWEILRLNSDLLMRPFRLPGGFEVSVFGVIAGAMLLGLVAAAIQLGLSEFDAFLRRSKARQASRQQSQADSLSYSGINLMLEGRHEDALRRFKEALALQPDHGRAGLRMGQVLRLLGKPREAYTQHRRLAEAYASRPEAKGRIPWSLRSELAQDLRALERYEEAAELARKGIAENPERRDEGEALLLSIYVDARQWDKAEDVFEALRKRARSAGEAVRCPEYDYVIPYRKALDLAGKGDSKSARKLLTGIVKRQPKFAPAYVELGRLYAEAGREDSAIEVWRRGLRGTGSLVFLSVLEEYFLDAGRPDRALEVFRGIARESGEILPRFLLGKLYYRLEMIDEAYEEFRSIEARVSHSATLHYFMGKVRERRGALAEAMENYKRALRESGVLALSYRCSSCKTGAAEWSDRCASCGAWGSLDLDLRTELSRDERPAEAPVYSSTA